MKANNLYYERGLPVYQFAGEQQTICVLFCHVLEEEEDSDSKTLLEEICIYNLVNVPCVWSTVKKPIQLGLFNAQSVNNKALAVKDYLVDHGLDLLVIRSMNIVHVVSVFTMYREQIVEVVVLV